MPKGRSSEYRNNFFKKEKVFTENIKGYIEARVLNISACS